MLVAILFDIVRIVVEEIADGHEFDPRDIQRFRDIDEYATMFLQHGQLQSEFDLDRALRIFKAVWLGERDIVFTVSRIPCRS